MIKIRKDTTHNDISPKTGEVSNNFCENQAPHRVSRKVVVGHIHFNNNNNTLICNNQIILR